MKNNKGLTLIEIVITIAITSIMAIAVLTMFNISITNISESGNKTERVLRIKEEVDEEIINNKEKTTNTDKVKVTIDGIIKDREVDGKIIEIKDSDIKITTFVPNKPKSTK
ncbi:type II secretion system protein J [Tissierella pigra]|uniref:Prepilin-type N-terminal cleavage/methylation domain-containing protein n=1 Tax=Tissierella pigra TaxID=2607614 RepID=A0A6N7XTK6_9FIRM|nr:prepilin-type N-terminal cleavage/methylation domain-containing protein [Tissierella pigra]MST99873.1 prepilin-type N-terminal cleavage/methylation domain-containing protein [Tissierella pigra]